MVDAFILVMLVFLWFWDYPVDHPVRRLIHVPSLPLAWLGLWHSWAMFAPEPIHVNRRLHAVLTLADGTQQVWCPLAPHLSTRLQNTLYARSFKFESSLFGPGMQPAWQSLCDFLVRQAGSNGHHVREVALIRESRRVNSWDCPSIYSEPVRETFYRCSPTLPAAELSC
jgi:hypothetical protein